MTRTVRYKENGIVIIAFFIFILSSFLFAEESSTRAKTPRPDVGGQSQKAGNGKYEIRAFRIAESIRVDGRLDEPAWAHAVPAADFTQREPREGELATEPTEVRILYDDEFLYIGAMCFDSRPEEIRVNDMRRDAEIRNNDYFEVVFDTYLNRRSGYYFSVNPLGARSDGLIQDNGSNVSGDWDGIWTAQTVISERGWSVEMAIPFQTLRFLKKESQVWGVNFGRQIARKREETFWTPILRDYGMEGNYKVSYFGILSGLENLNQGKKLQVMPYIIGGLKKPDRFASLRADGDLGLDMKYRLASNLTADITVNTDFAQVEADQEQFNLTRFSLYFPEKREFFLEGAGVFRMGDRNEMYQGPSVLMFFSRSIGLSKDGREVPILGGVRVTGKTGGFELGALNITTDRLPAASNGDDGNGEVERMNYSVLRLKRNIFSKSSIGAMVLNKESLDGSAYNRGAGLDFNLAFGNNIKWNGFAFKSFSPGLKDKDMAACLDFVYDKDFLNVELQCLDIGANFNSEMGFVNRTDIRRYYSNLSFRPRPGILNIRKSYLYNTNSYVENHDGRLESRSVELGNYNTFQNGAMLSLSYKRLFEQLVEPFEVKSGVIIPVGRHSFDEWMVMFESDRSRDISLSAHLRAGGFYCGNLFRWEGEGRFRISKNFNMELMGERNAFNLPVAGGKFNTAIAAGRFIYSFTPDLFAKTYVQWNGSENLFKVNFLVRWIYRPGANVYFIYNETREVGETKFVRDRVLMLKVSFLFDL